MCVCVCSAFLGDIENTDDTVAASDGEHLATVAEVSGEARPRQVEDSVARLEETVTVKHFDFVRARATGQDQVVGVLLELSCVQLHWGGRGQLFVERNVFSEVA